MSWKKSLTAMAILFMAAQAWAGLWTDDYDKALKDASASGKNILVDFTGSDWCGWCKKLDREVFSKKQFKDYAEQNLICVEVDFPQNKPQSRKQKEKNAALQEQYKVKGYPSIILLNSKGEQIAQTGYQEGGAEAYVKHLQELIDGAKK